MEERSYMMDKHIDERDFELLEHDKYTFSVLRRVIVGNCELILSDHERLMICHTKSPYPIWIWTADDATESEMERAYAIINEHFTLGGGQRINLKYGLAEYFIERARREGKDLSVAVNMLAYDCPSPRKPTVIADGGPRKCDMSDIDTLVEFTVAFHGETGVDRRSREEYYKDAEESISSGNMYFWRNEVGVPVACCKYILSGELASLNLVYTRPEYRRRHYAENLVYEITRIAEAQGYLPMLYTDADYLASNACYEKLGYIMRGRLCTLK